MPVEFVTPEPERPCLAIGNGMSLFWERATGKFLLQVGKQEVIFDDRNQVEQAIQFLASGWEYTDPEILEQIARQKAGKEHG